MPSLIESLKAERKIAAESVRIVGRLRPFHALVLIRLSLGARAVVELDELRVKAREPAQGARIAFGVGRALRGLAFGIGGHALLQMDQPLVERFEQPADDVAPAELLDGRALYLGFACGAGLRPRLQLLGADEPNPTFLLGTRGKPPLADAVRQRDAPLRPVAMDKVVLDALPVGKSRLVLIGNFGRPLRLSPLPRRERVARPSLAWASPVRGRAGVSSPWARQAWCRRARQ